MIGVVLASGLFALVVSVWVPAVLSAGNRLFAGHPSMPVRGDASVSAWRAARRRRSATRGAAPWIEFIPPVPGETPAGWYPAPHSAPGAMRFWDGRYWTDQIDQP